MNDIWVLASVIVSAWAGVLAAAVALHAPSLRERGAWWVLGAALAAMAVRRALFFVTPWPNAELPPTFTNVFTLAVLVGALLFIWQVKPIVRRAWQQRSELEAARLQFRRALNGSPDAIAIVDAEGRYSFVNEASCTLFGYAPEQVIGRHYSEFFAEVSPPIGATERARAGTERGSTSVVRHIRRGDGDVVAVETDVISLGDGTLLFIGHDITERVRIAKTLEHERARLDLAQQISMVGSSEIDLITGDRWWSQEMFRLFGFEPDESGQPPSFQSARQRVHPDDRVISARSTDLALSGQEHEPLTYRVVHPSGEVRHLLANARVEHDGDGTPIRVVRVLADVTELLNLEEQLARARRLEAVGTLAAGVAHDFNNILTVIGGNIDLAAAGDHTRLESASDGVQRAADLVRQLLAVARRPADQQSTLSSAIAHRQSTVDLRSLLQDVDIAMRGILDPSIGLYLDAGEAPVRVRGDRTDLDRVLTNLLINARDAVVDRARHAVSGSGDDEYQPAIHVSLRIVLGGRSATAHAEVNVADNGSGVPEDVRERLFEPFFSTKSASRGTGLGLASARGIVQHLGGVIEFESKPDRGSTFRVRLPLAAEAVAAPRISPPTALTTDTAGTTILLVDDEVALLDFAAGALCRAGMTVECVSTGRAAIEALLARPYDLAVVDVRLGGDIDGWDVLRKVQSQRPDQRLLIWSGTASAEDAMERGAIGILHKPFDAGALHRAVRIAMGVTTHDE